MAVPSDLTATLIVTEAYKKMGIASPTSAQITRAEGYFLREILNEIWMSPDNAGESKYKSLQNLDVQASVSGQSKYAFPTDFDTEITLDLLSGTHTDTAQTGGNTSITLVSDEDIAEASIEGAYIFLTAGTGSTGFRQCISYDTSTMIATVDRAWDTNPDNTTTYLICEQAIDIDLNNIRSEEVGGLGNTSFVKGKPSEYNKITEGASDYLLFDKPCDAVYAIHLRYYVDPNRVDLTGSLMTKIYNNWQDVLTAGVSRKIAEDENDDKFKVFDAEFKRMLAALKLKELISDNEFAGIEAIE